ncbi:hypothetical protein [Actinomadura logoneensis]|nr:hypothetical protein [Actinomadura logoneensis]
MDELHHEAALSEPTRERPAAHLDRPQVLEPAALVSVFVLAGVVLDA